MIQLMKFGGVGLFATLVHIGIFELCYLWLGISGVLSNLAAFLVAFQVSYFGHAHWTFKSNQEDTVDGSKWRFLLVALNGLLLNSLFAFIFLDFLSWGQIPYLISILCITPLITFAASKYWAFNRAE